MRLRLVSWNVESLARWLEAPALPDRMRALGDPDVFCVQETRVRPVDTDLIAAMRSALPGYSCHAAFANDRFNVTFRGGRQHGVATWVRDSLGPVVSATPAWDREGRVVVTALPEHSLAVINLYAVNGTSKPYRDPDTGEAAGNRHALKRAVQTRVLDLAAELRANANVIIAGDWNVSRTRDDVTPRLRTEEPHARARAELNERLERDGWIDAFRALHPDERRYSWFGRTRSGALDAARVDFVLVDHDLMSRVRTADILDDRAQRPHSDHAPLALELALQAT